MNEEKSNSPKKKGLIFFLGVAAAFGLMTLLMKLDPQASALIEVGFWITLLIAMLYKASLMQDATPSLKNFLRKDPNRPENEKHR